MKIKTEGVITVYDAQNTLTTIVLKDEVSRKNIFFSVTEMGFEDIGVLLEGIDGKAL